jgi:uncharacterized protein (DUF1800 family)
VEEGERALDILAQHPATARRISFKLAQYFVSDTPDPALVTALADVFQKTNGDIRAVLAALCASPAFRDPETFGTKFKTPLRYTISSVRAAGIPLRNFRPLYGVLTQLGQAPYGCATPDGYKCTEDAWLNADAMTRRITFAIALAAGRLPLHTPPPDEGLPVKQPEKMAARMEERLTRDAAHGENPPGAALDATALARTLGDSFSQATRAAIADAQPQLHASMMLGSPEFMRC